MKYLLAVALFWASSSWGRDEAPDPCERGLTRAGRFIVEASPDANVELIQNLAQFDAAWDRAVELAIPENAVEDHTFETLYLQDQWRNEFLRISFRLRSPSRIVITNVERVNDRGQLGFYERFAAHHELERIIFDYPAGEAPIRVGFSVYTRVVLEPAMRAKLWIKHGRRLDDIITVLGRVTKGVREAPGSVVALAYQRNIPVHVYFKPRRGALELRTMYEREKP